METPTSQPLPWLGKAIHTEIDFIVFLVHEEHLFSDKLFAASSLGTFFFRSIPEFSSSVSTAVASASGLDDASRKDGLWGYNGCLVGCAAAVFIAPLPVDLASMTSGVAAGSSLDLAGAAAASGLAATTLGAVVTPFVGAAFGTAMGRVPQWTLAFNAVTISALLCTRPMSHTADGEGEAAALDTVAQSATAAASSPDLISLACSPLKGVSQIFVVDSAATGAAILGGMALYSPALALHLLGGSLIGSFTGWALCDAGLEGVVSGLWGYNSALTSLGVGVFFVNSSATIALSAGGAAVTSVLFGAAKSVFATSYAPCLTLPFCAAMSGCYLLGMGQTVPGLRLAANPHSPEKNSEAVNAPSFDTVKLDGSPSINDVCKGTSKSGS